MRVGLCLLLAAIMVFSLSSALSEDGVPSVSFLSYTLAVTGIQDSPNYIQGNPEPVDKRFVVITFTSTQQAISLFDIADNVALFSLEDSQGQSYEGMAYFPHSMLFLFGPGVFSAAQMQAAFDMLFIIPNSLPLSDLYLLVRQNTGGFPYEVPAADIALIPDRF
jgi:hypothetical protein